jgi:hypothetical protein
MHLIMKCPAELCRLPTQGKYCAPESAQRIEKIDGEEGKDPRGQMDRSATRESLDRAGSGVVQVRRWGWKIENYGAEPDIDMAPHEHRQGKDARLDRGSVIAELRKLFGKRPACQPARKS